MEFEGFYTLYSFNLSFNKMMSTLFTLMTCKRNALSPQPLSERQTWAFFFCAKSYSQEVYSIWVVRHFILLSKILTTTKSTQDKRFIWSRLRICEKFDIGRSVYLGASCFTLLCFRSQIMVIILLMMSSQFWSLTLYSTSLIHVRNRLYLTLSRSPNHRLKSQTVNWSPTRRLPVLRLYTVEHLLSVTVSLHTEIVRVILYHDYRGDIREV